MLKLTISLEDKGLNKLGKNLTTTSKGLIITFLGVFIMSLESLFIKLAQVPALTFSFYIGIFMFFAMATTLLLKERSSIKNITKNSFPILLFCGTLTALSNVFFISAVKTTSVANVVLIFSSAALFSSFFAFLFYKEKMTRNILISSFFIFIGLFIIFSEEFSLGSMKGNLYALLCTIFFAISFVVLSKHKAISRVALTALGGIFLSLISFLLADDLTIDLKTLSIVAFMGLMISPISRVLIGNGTKFISASEVSLLMIVETIMAPIWVWLFLNEIPSQNTFIGGSIILITLAINSIYKVKQKI